MVYLHGLSTRGVRTSTEPVTYSHPPSQFSPSASGRSLRLGCGNRCSGGCQYSPEQKRITNLWDLACWSRQAWSRMTCPHLVPLGSNVEQVISQSSCRRCPLARGSPGHGQCAGGCFRIKLIGFYSNILVPWCGQNVQSSVGGFRLKMVDFNSQHPGSLISEINGVAYRRLES